MKRLILILILMFLVFPSLVRAEGKTLEVWGAYYTLNGEIRGFSGFSNHEIKFSHGWIPAKFSFANGLLTDIGYKCWVLKKIGNYNPTLKSFISIYQYEPEGYIRVKWFWDRSKTKRTVFVRIFNGERFTESKYVDGVLKEVNFNGKIKIE